VTSHERGNEPDADDPQQDAEPAVGEEEMQDVEPDRGLDNAVQKVGDRRP
jgi:hypothetical protein